MMMTDTVKSDTPRTDAFQYEQQRKDAAENPAHVRDDSVSLVNLDTLGFARQLERELSAFQQAMPEEPTAFKLPYAVDQNRLVVFKDYHDTLCRAHAALKMRCNQLEKQVQTESIISDRNYWCGEHDKQRDRAEKAEAKLAACEKDEPTEAMLIAGDEAILDGLQKAAIGCPYGLHPEHASWNVYKAMRAALKENKHE